MLRTDLIDRVSTPLDSLTPAILAELKPTITIETLKTQSHIVADKLSGQVLSVRSGALRRAVQMEAPIVQGSDISGRVFVTGDVKYAAIQEFGGRTPPHDIVPSKAKALAFLSEGKQVFARVVHHPGSNIPERSYMRSGLADRRDEIVEAITAAANRGKTKAMAT